jgi:hypothetical protein
MKPARRSFALSLFLVGAAACGESSGRKPLACQLDTDCPAEAKCVLGACVAGSLPQAKIVVHASQGELVSHRDITFDGSQSQDMNPRGSVTQYAWSVKRGRTAACDPTATAGARPSFTTNFQCPGEYVVELQVTNDLKLHSLPEQATLEIAPSSSPPTITSTGPNALAVHRCEGSPLVCRALDAAGSSGFQLSVTATDVEDGPNLAYAWTYEPPAGVDPAKAHVTFEPSANTPTPIVRVTTDGAAIAGDWVFQANVTDSSKLTTVKGQTLTVANAAPAVAITPGDVVLEHGYFVATDRYLANATVTAALSDPDGDPIISAQLSMVEDAPTSCSFRVLSSALAPDGFTGQIELSCPGAAAQELIGTASRALVLEIADVNGKTTTLTRPLTVADAPPAATWSMPGAAGLEVAGHTVVPCADTVGAASCFSVDAPIPFALGDVEGDPVSVTLAAVGLPSSGASFLVGGGRFRLLVPTTNPGLLRDASGASPVSYQLVARDPWKATTADFRLSVANRAPVVTLLPAAAAAHWYSSADQSYHAVFDLAAVSDPDGDPVSAAVKSSDPACGGATVVNGRVQAACTMRYDAASGPATLAAFLGSTTPTGRRASASASDPWAASAETPQVALSIADRPPAIGYQATSLAAVATCQCVQRLCEWVPTGVGRVSFDPLISDPDGDPLHVTFTFGNGSAPVDKVCFGSDCAVGFTGNDGDTVTLSVTDGAMSAPSRSYTVSTVCSNDTTQPCGPPGGCP